MQRGKKVTARSDGERCSGCMTQRWDRLRYGRCRGRCGHRCCFACGKLSLQVAGESSALTLFKLFDDAQDQRASVRKPCRSVYRFFDQLCRESVGEWPVVVWDTPES